MTNGSSELIYIASDLPEFWSIFMGHPVYLIVYWQPCFYEFVYPGANISRNENNNILHWKEQTDILMTIAFSNRVRAIEITIPRPEHRMIARTIDQDLTPYL